MLIEQGQLLSAYHKENRAGRHRPYSPGQLTTHFAEHATERYCIEKQVGTGGFGAVYKARDTLFSHRLVAIKEMNQSGLSPRELAEASAAFQHEALASLHALSSPMHNIAKEGRMGVCRA